MHAKEDISYVFLVYGGENELGVKGYVDASFLTNPKNSQSHSGYVFFLNRAVVTWKSSKQETVTASTAEAGYVVASEATKEAV